MHLLLMTFGPNERHHLQGYFCIYSFLAGNAALSSINIMTDRPEFYKNIENRVNLIPVEEGTLRDWRGPHDYFWRIKIKAIGAICAAHPGEAVIYLDTDTFLYNDFSPALQSMRNGRAVMHVYEAPLKEIQTRTARRMYDKLKGQTFGNLSDLGDYEMWNAGVIITPNTLQMAEIDLALQVCDEMSRLGVPEHFIEQSSVSIALKKTYGLDPAAPYLAHYWSTKDEWNLLIARFFQHAYLQGLTQEETIMRFRQLPLTDIPVSKKEKRMKSRLQKRIADLFPDKNLGYLDRNTGQ